MKHKGGIMQYSVLLYVNGIESANLGFYNLQSAQQFCLVARNSSDPVYTEICENGIQIESLGQKPVPIEITDHPVSLKLRR